MGGEFFNWNDFVRILLKHYPYDKWGCTQEITENTRVDDLVDDVDDFIAVIFNEFTEDVNLGNLEHNIHDDTYDDG